MSDAPAPTSVLLLEDCPSDRELLSIACGRAGLAIDWAVTETCAEGQAAFLEIIAGTRAKPQLIIMDLRLPDGPSTDLLPLLIERLTDIPVILFTTSSSPDDRARIPAGSGIRYLVKPHSFRGYDEILTHIRAIGLEPAHPQD